MVAARLRSAEVTLKSKRSNGVVVVSDPFMDVAGCAAYLARTERWVRRNVNEGNLPYVRMGRRLAFRRSALETWIAENSVGPEGER